MQTKSETHGGEGMMSHALTQRSGSAFSRAGGEVGLPTSTEARDRSFSLGRRRQRARAGWGFLRTAACRGSFTHDTCRGLSQDCVLLTFAPRTFPPRTAVRERSGTSFQKNSFGGYDWYMVVTIRASILLARLPTYGTFNVLKPVEGSRTLCKGTDGEAGGEVAWLLVPLDQNRFARNHIDGYCPTSADPQVAQPVRCPTTHCVGPEHQPTPRSTHCV